MVDEERKREMRGMKDRRKRREERIMLKGEEKKNDDLGRKKRKMEDDIRVESDEGQTSLEGKREK